ncbi:aminopeptidase N [Streptomyces albus]|uniref:aminopeptidase N n=1 Tax=Streptomyces albus TaxID=1888 RepID=UPI0004CB8A06|nr:aminopeptidase N [Streptomyces albus]
MPALTRDEARTRARLLDVRGYTVDLDLTRGDDLFGSTTVIRFTAATPGDTFAEVAPARLRRVLLDGRELDPALLRGNRLPLTGLTAGAHELRVEADMRYSRTGEGMHRFTDPADGETYVYTQGFLDDGPRIFAAFDQPDLKAVFEVSVTAPAGWTVLSNAVTTPADTTPDGNPAEDPAENITENSAENPAPTRWRAAPTPPISPYLLAVAAGPWTSVRTEHAGLPFGVHVRRSLGPHLHRDSGEILDITRRCFDRYHEIFDEPYPFDSYDQAFVPEFNYGAMENPGLVTFRDEHIHRSAVTDTERQARAMVIAHEMAHMWFGNLVTLRWWDDIWLNESFAEYLGFQTLTEATRHRDTWTDFAVTRKGWGYDADQRPTTHPVAPAPEDVPDTASALLNFDGISYAKGASALRQLVARLGEKDFLAGINDHITRHRFGNATLADFIDSLARASAEDVHGWAERWLRTTGVDTLTAEVTAEAGPTTGPATTGPATTGEATTTGEADADGATLAAQPAWRLTVRHTGTRPHRITVTTYDHDQVHDQVHDHDPVTTTAEDAAPAEGAAPAAGAAPAEGAPPAEGTAPTADAATTGPAPAGRLTLRDRFTTDVPADGDAPARTLPGRRPPLVLLNGDDLDYAKIRLDPRSRHTALAALSGLPDPITRAVVWNTARDMVRDGELAPAAYLRAVRAHLPHETDLAIVQGVLGFARQEIADRYLPPPDRPEALAALTAVCRALLDRTADGSAPGLRLAAVRGCLDNLADTGELRAWLTAGTVPGGPALDPELRWRLLLRLTVLGAAGHGDIDTALAADPGATGREGAARCRAALPDPAAKETAWNALFHSGEPSNRIVKATAEGFWQPEQREILTGYVHRYHPAAVAAAARRGPAIATLLGSEGYPAHAVDEETLRLGRHCLRHDDPAPALRRKLADQLDDLARILRARATAGPAVT